MARARRSLVRLFWITVVVGASVGAAIAALHVLDLDREVRLRFAGARWALPAQVYAAPMELYPGVPLTHEALVAEVRRLGYRPVASASQPGTFSVDGRRVEVHTRPLQFWDGRQPALRVRLEFDAVQVTEITDVATGDRQPLLRLDALLIGSIYPQHGEDRVLVRLDAVPPLLPAGLIHVEDRSFVEHPGLDPKGIARALWANLRAGRTVQGGSTITQQLVKNFFLSNERSWQRKLNEAVMALLLEFHYSKEEILEAYLNEVHLGQDGGRAVHGFGLASRFYFNKPITELQAQEVATLIALVKGPSYFNPRRHPQRARDRRDLVLGMLLEAGMLDAESHAQAVAADLGIAGGVVTGGAVQYPAFVDLVKRQLRGQYAEVDLTHEGLRIFTTLDPRAQEALERNLVEGLDGLEADYRMAPQTLQGAGVVTTVDGGEVLALVGDRKVRYPGFNRALDARRPVGSLAKPFVYLAALMQPERYHLATDLMDEPVEIRMPHGAVWTPENYEKEPHGAVPLHVALSQSYNLATVHLGMDIGLANVRQILRAAGMGRDPPELPSLLLGAVEQVPLDVAQMYGTLAASGYRSPVLAIREVLTKEGEPLTRYPLRIRQSLPEAAVFLLNWALEQVMVSGTGKLAARVLPPGLRLAGKTGTTDELRDSWFAGFGRDRVAVVWVGRDDNQPAGLTGAVGALRIWAPLMRDLRTRGRDPVPPASVAWTKDCRSGLELPYIEGHEPPELDECGGWKSLFDW